MFLWLNCFVASIECVPGLALNSCRGPGGSSSGAQAAGTGITLILLESKSVPQRWHCLPCRHLPGTCGTGVVPRVLWGRVWAMWGREGAYPPWLGCLALCASFSCCRDDFGGCVAASS